MHILMYILMALDRGFAILEPPWCICQQLRASFYGYPPPLWMTNPEHKTWQWKLWDFRLQLEMGHE